MCMTITGFIISFLLTLQSVWNKCIARCCKKKKGEGEGDDEPVGHGEQVDSDGKVGPNELYPGQVMKSHTAKDNIQAEEIEEMSKLENIAPDSGRDKNDDIEIEMKQF